MTSPVQALIDAVFDVNGRLTERLAAVYALGIVADEDAVSAIDRLCKDADLPVKLQVAAGEARGAATERGANPPSDLDLANFEGAAYLAFDERMTYVMNRDGGLARFEKAEPEVSDE